MSFRTFDQRNTKPQSGPRQPEFTNPDTGPSEGCGLMIEFPAARKRFERAAWKKQRSDLPQCRREISATPAAGPPSVFFRRAHR
jgi:hypothetical protein